MRLAARWCALPSVALAAFVCLPASAQASSGAVALSSYGNAAPPLVAYDAGTGDTYVAWTASAQDNGVYVCIVEADTQSCADGGPIELTDSQFSGTDDLFLGDLNVLPSGDVVVLGATANSGSVAWVSAPGGADFDSSGQGLQNNGNPVTPVEDYYTPGDSAVLGDSDIGLLDSYGNYFEDVPVAGPEAPAAPLAASNANGEYAAGPSDTEDAPSIGAEQTPGAGSGTDTVVTAGVNNNSDQGTPSGCQNYAATGYTVRVGSVDGTSNSSGTLNGEAPDATLLACAADDPVVVSGGGAGIGVVEQEGSDVSGFGDTDDIDFHKFTATDTGGSFGASQELANVTSESIDGVNEIDATEDSGDGIYAMWNDDQGYVLDYSPNGGTTWDGPVISSVNGSDGNVAGIGNGYSVIAYTANPSGGGSQVFLQTVYAIPPSPVTVTTKQTSGSSTGANISIPAGTVGETDQATLSGTKVASATGTMTYALYSNASCTKVAVSDGTAAVSGSTAAASAPITKGLAPGTYYWQASYSGNTFNQAGKSACGSEKLTVTQPATAANSATTNGKTVTVTITCSSACTVTVTIEVPGTTSDLAQAGMKKKSKLIVIGTGRLTEKKAGKGKLKLKLNKNGKKLLKKDHDKAKATLVLKTKTKHGTFSSKHTLKIKK